MTPSLKTQLAERVMALGRSRDVHHVRFGLIKKNLNFCEVGLDIQPLLQLLGHQFFSVTDTDNGTAWNMKNLLRMLISYFATTDYCYF
jgi:hypothetical protein